MMGCRTGGCRRNHFSVLSARCCYQFVFLFKCFLRFSKGDRNAREESGRLAFATNDTQNQHEIAPTLLTFFIALPLINITVQAPPLPISHREDNNEDLRP